MQVLIPIIAILMVFGAPTYLFKRMLDIREKRMELEAGSKKQLESGAMKELEDLREANRLLEARVEAMEDTVFSGDFELNQKLKQIALNEDAAALPSASSPAGKMKLGTGKS